MKYLRIPVILAVLSVAFMGVSEAGDSWFDLENCAICVNLSAEEGLMDHLQWDTHTISNGMLTVMSVDPEYMEAFDRAHANMGKTVKKLQSGEAMDLCGFCMSYGGLMMAGAQDELVETMVGQVSLITSSDEEIVAKIHEHANRTIAEYEAYLAAQGKSD